MKALDLFNDALPNGFVRKPYVIAEAGVNHEGNIDLAKRLIQEASEEELTLLNSKLTKLILLHQKTLNFLLGYIEGTHKKPI